MTRRVWELDALRGICILGMVIVHFIYDLQLQDLPATFRFVQNWGGTVFVVLSGICATLGSRSVRRGAVVFGCGMIVSAVTWGMYRLGFADKGIIIYFGVLHCLGVCMLLWPVFRRLSWQWLVLLGIPMVLIGLWLATRSGVSFPWLMPLGLFPAGLSTSDYFPLLPYLGFFLIGAAIGRTLYREKKTLLPGIDPETPPIAFLRLCGKYSLHIYLLHQPVLSILISILGGIL